MTVEQLMDHLRQIPKEYKDLEAKVVIDGHTYSIGAISSDGEIFGCNRNGLDNIYIDDDYSSVKPKYRDEDWKALDEIWGCVMCGKCYEDLSNDQKQTLVDFKDLTYEELEVAAKRFVNLGQMKKTIDSEELFLKAAKSEEKIISIVVACLIYNR